MKKVKNKLINVTPMALIICTLNEDVAPGKKATKLINVPLRFYRTLEY